MRRGWTLLEVLVSVAVLGGILIVISEILSTAQRSLSSKTAATHQASTRTEAVTALTSVLERLALNARPQFTDGTSQITRASDFHFVCGPASELLPDMDDVVGDALFYQMLNAEGLVECGGLFVQFNDDIATRPRLIPPSTPSIRCFRLMRWQQPTSQSVLFDTRATGRPMLNDAAKRDDLYRWFREDVTKGRNCHVVTDHVLLMHVMLPQGSTLYDTRRHQWEGVTVRSMQSRHLLPSPLSLRLVTTDLLSWQQAVESRDRALPATWVAFVSKLNQASGDPEAALTSWLERHHLRHRILSVDR